MGWMDWTEPNSSIVSVGVLIAFVQVWWIRTLVVRNRRRLGAEPLSATAFQKELDRILASIVIESKD